MPVPLPGALTYSIPQTLAPLVRPGTRVGVRVGKRRLTGLVVDLPETPPEGVRLRPLDEVLDPEPILPPDLIRLGTFVASYYLAPVGEVFRGLLPSDLPAWGRRRASLTSAGAIAPPRGPGEARVVEALRSEGRLSLSQLQERLGGEGLEEVVEAMGRAGRLRLADSGESSSRYLTAYELPPGDRDAQRKACGRSAPARAVVDFLAAVGRPATAGEITEAVDCGSGVLRRLASLGILRKFSQMERLSLGHHVMPEQESEKIVLRPDQAAAVEALGSALDEQRFAPFLLHGMTGSGKTEVYLRAVQRTLELGRSAILLVPEIALVPALARAVQARFGDEMAILHSGLGASERQQEWRRIRQGKARVVLGPRSAIFAPVPKLGFVVVDEEQDSAYKQEVQPRYHGRDIALVRGQQCGAVVLLVSATPAMESRHNVEVGKYRGLRLTERAGQGSLPEGILVDLKTLGAERKPGEIVFSRRLEVEIENTLAVGAQVILLRNRRGYSPLLLCRACGEDHRCDDCGLPRTFHRREATLVCHYCGSIRPVPERCGKCEEEALEPVGTGTERLEEQFRERFPGVSVDVLDRDVVRRKGGAAGVLERFRRGDSKVLVGTQMVSKGHHFPNVGLTAVLHADTYLRFPDFRAVERTYNLLTQLAGRAGRGEVPGRVVIQTFYPQHYAIRAALEHDDEGFAREEMKFRRMFHYPPFTRMVQLLLRDTDRARGRQRMADLARALSVDPVRLGIRITGPAPAPLEKLRGKWRFQLLLRGPSFRQLRELLLRNLPEGPHPDLTIDVDPQDLL